MRELTNKEQSLYDEADNPHGLERWLLSRDEIKIVNKLVKEGILIKGIADTKQGQRIYFVNKQL